MDISDPLVQLSGINYEVMVGASLLRVPRQVVISGKYAFVARGFSDDGLEILDISGIDAPSATIGNLAVGTINIWENASVFNDLQIGGGLNVDVGGIFSQGAVSIFTSSTYLTTASSTAALTVFQKGTGDIVNFFNSSTNVFTIKSNGNVGIGTTTPNYLLQMESSGGGYYNQTTNAWSNGSSLRWKENINPISNAIGTIMQLNPVTFKWKEEQGGADSIGFIAEEFGQVVPELVDWNKDDLTVADGMNYGNVTALLTKAIQEQQIQLEPLTLSLNLNTTTRQLSFGTSTFNVNPTFYVKESISFIQDYLNTTNTLKLSFNTSTVFESLIDDFSSAQSFIFNALNFNTSSNDTTLLSLRSNSTPVFSVMANGDTNVSGNLRAGSLTLGTSTNPGDLAEKVDINPSEYVEAGDVLMVDDYAEDMYKKSNQAYETKIAGVVSENPTIVIGNGKTNHTAHLAMTGRTIVKVNIQNGEIKRGDLLTSSDIPGQAMRYDQTIDNTNQIVGIIGIALQNADQTTKKIPVLIRTGWTANKTDAINNLENQVQTLLSKEGIDLDYDTQTFDITENNTLSEITYLDSHFDLKNHALLNTKSINTINRNAWAINDEGVFTSKIPTENGGEVVYGMTASEAELNFSGEGKLENGQAFVPFSSQEQNIIDFNQKIKINLTLTSDGAIGVYVSEKTDQGFIVKEMNDGRSNATFDWFVIAKRREGVVDNFADSVVNNTSIDTPIDTPVDNPVNNFDLTTESTEIINEITPSTTPESSYETDPNHGIINEEIIVNTEENVEVADISSDLVIEANETVNATTNNSDLITDNPI